MSRFHVNPKTGVPGRCEAQSPSTCKFKNDDGTAQPHYDSAKDAGAAAAEILETRYGTLQSFVRKEIVDVSVENNPRYKGLSGVWPAVDGVKVKMENTGKILTVRILDVQESEDGIPSGHVVAVDEDGVHYRRKGFRKDEQRFQIISGPDTPEFLATLDNTVLLKDLVSIGKRVEKAKSRVNAAIRGDGKIGENGIGTITEGRTKRTGSHSEERVFYIEGENPSSPSKRFTHSLWSDGTVTSQELDKRTPPSRNFANTKKVLESLSNDEVKELFESQEEFDIKAKDFVESVANVRKFNHHQQ